MDESVIESVMGRSLRRAARGLRRDFGEIENLQASHKGLDSFVAAAIKSASDQLLSDLSEARPDFGYQVQGFKTRKGKERAREGAYGSGTYLWVIDPLNGRMNFRHARDHFTLSLALVRNNSLIAGAVFNPIRDDYAFAERGRGAFLNRRRLRVGRRQKRAQTLIGLWPGFERWHRQELIERLDWFRGCAGTRQSGSQAFDLVDLAAGSLGAVVQRPLSWCAVAAGVLIAQEAGALVSADDGRSLTPDSSGLIAAHPDLHVECVAGMAARASDFTKN